MDNKDPYWAFISYSHEDKKWAEWLHRTIEAYRIPRRLLGSSSSGDELPKRLFPVFRDKDELASSSDLGRTIRAALQKSNSLLVICSPASAKSRWVNEEVAEFLKLGRSDKIFCLIVGGEPKASGAAASRGDSEGCFCPALGGVSEAADEGEDETAREPLAADVRAGQDDRHTAALRLIAGILGVPFDQLWQRDVQRRRRQRIGWISAAAAMVAITLGAWHVATSRIDSATRESLRAESVALHESAVRHFAEGRVVQAIESARSGLPGFGKAPDRPVVPQLTAFLAMVQRSTGLRCRAAGTAIGWDGDDLLGLTVEGRITRWNGHDCRELSQWNPGLGPINHADVDKGFSRIILRTADYRSHLFDLKAQRKIGEFPTDAMGIALVNYDGKRVATTTLRMEGQTTQGAVKLWDATTAAFICETPLQSMMGAVIFSEDGRRFATMSAPGVVSLYRIADCSTETTLDAQDGPIGGLAFQHNGDKLLSTSLGGRLRIWQVGDAATPRAYGEPVESVFAAGFSTSGDKIVIVGVDGAITVKDVGTGRTIMSTKVVEVPFPVGTVQAQFSADDRRLVVLDLLRNRFHVMDVATGKVLRSFSEISPATAGVFAHFDASARRITTYSLAGPNAGVSYFHVWDTEPDDTIARLEGHNGRIGRAFFDARRETLITVRQDDLAELQKVTPKAAHLWRVSDGRRLATIDMQAGQGWLFYAEFNPRGGRFVTDSVSLEDLHGPAAGKRPTIRLWNAVDGRLISDLPLLNRSPFFSPDGALFGTVENDSALKIWDAAAGAPVLSIAPRSRQQYLTLIAFSPSGNALSIPAEKSLDLVDPRTGKTLVSLSGHQSPLGLLSFSSDGRMVAAADSGGNVLIWDTTSGATKAVLSGIGDQPVLLSFADENETLVTGLRSGNVSVWNWRTGARAATIQPPETYSFTSMLQSGKWLKTHHAESGVTRIWDRRSGQQIAYFDRDAADLHWADDLFISHDGDTPVLKRFKIMDNEQVIAWARNIVN